MGVLWSTSIFVGFSCVFHTSALAQSALDNRSVDYYLDKADGFERKSSPHKSIELCDAILKRAPKAVRAYAIKARSLIDLKKMPEAWAILLIALKIEGNQSETYIAMGRWHLAKGDLPAAIKDFENAVSQDKRNFAAYRTLAQICEKARQFDKALKAYDQLIQINPALAEGYALRGEYLERRAKFKEAVADYSSALSRSAKNVSMRSKRADLYFKQGLFVQALGDYATIAAENPYDEEAVASKAQVHLALKQYKEGIADANRAIELDADDGRAYYLRAKNYQGLGQRAAADADFKKSSSSGYSGSGEVAKPK